MGNDQPRELARPGVYETVLEILNSLGSGKLLDIPAGEGAFASRLLTAGYEVRCCDLYPEIFSVPDIEIRRGDLTARLPFEDSEFRFVTCLEGLEHTADPGHAIEEFCRILQPDGHLVISVPNILNIEERLKWLVHGYTSHFKPLSREHLDGLRDTYGENMEIALHVNPIGYSELRYYLENNGFRLLGIHRDRSKPNLWMYWPLIGLIRLIGGLTPDQKRKERWTDELNSANVLMGGNTIILHAVKQ